MGLEIEEFERKKGKVPVASYVGENDREWLQDHRIELNAMTSPQFLRWLTQKFEQRATVAKKVVPDETVLRQQAEEQARVALRRRAVEKLLKEHEARITYEVNSRVGELNLDLSGEEVDQILSEKPAQSWRDAVNGLVSSQLDE